MIRQKRPLSAASRKKIFAYLLLIPFTVGFLLFFVKPLFLSFYYSLNSINLSGAETVYKFKGFKNYTDALFVTAEFREYLLSALKNLAVNVPLILFFSLFAATLLNQEFYGKNFSRIILFLPVILSTGILLDLEMSDYLIRSGQTALDTAGANLQNSATYTASLGFEDLMLSLNMPDQVTGYIQAVIQSFYTVLISSGVQIVLLLAAWQSIPSSLYEASAIEGATAWEDFWKITIPMISPYIFVCALYTVIDTFTGAGNKLVEYIRSIAAGTVMDYGLASAMSWIYFIMIALCLGLIALLFLRTKFVVYQER